MGEIPKQDLGGDAEGTYLMHSREPDFSGWASKANLKCADGRTILPDAFAHQDQTQVPLVWQHGHSSPENVLGHALLENRDEGVYCYGFFNDTDPAAQAKTLVQHDDIKSLSIFANQLVEKAKQVSHGIIREVSLVLAGANPGALIDNISLAHGDTTVELEDEAVIYTGLELEHADPSSKKDDEDEDDDTPTVQDVYDSMTPEQKDVVHYMVGAALEEQGKGSTKHSGDESSATHKTEEKEGTTRMSRNAFEQQKDDTSEKNQHALSHDALVGIVEDAKNVGSLKQAFENYALKHGIENIDVLFPDAKQVGEIQWDKRRTEWVAGVLNGTRHSPFSRIKTVLADITHEEARARGYIKGNFKKEEFFGLVKRTTTPTTVYKKQKLDRDDIIDITDLDVVSWLKGEMRLMLDEELARAILIGDGREVIDEDKIKDPAGQTDGVGIRSILNEHDLYAATLNVNVDDANSSQLEVVEAVMHGMELYKGSGSPTFYTTLGQLTKMILTKDNQGRRYWRTASELATEMGVANIVTVEVLESEPDLIGIIVNLADYTIGADKGGEVNLFDDFDIDYNQYKYLIETRVSGALTKIRSALIVKKVAGANVLVAPNEPGFNEATGNITIVDQAGVVYRRADTNAVVNAAGSPYNVAEGDSLKIYATPAAGYYFANNVDDEWTFTREAA